MIIYPAIDIKDGQCVRLRRGKAEESTVFSADPLQTAEHWVRQGASWLHVIDLDGAFQGSPVNLKLISAICSLPVRVQVGGGIRDEETARRYMQAGVSRLILGTIALEDPALHARICALFPGRVGVSLDAENGRLKSRGWVNDCGLTAEDALPGLTERGSAFIIYTDIERDGMRSGPNLEALRKICALSSLPVIAAGGVAALADVRDLYGLHLKDGLEGLITGRAIYERTLKLHEALAWVEAQRRMGNPGAPVV
ncbi:MAG: 1-(5-phosphoribosyl)-5-[(5-phosphoribosylamino)methylideneamino]imidazole-4-carboxamide isomerase [Deltaproteobacteria bacterium]|jgi:phosphoribosylformimino-5-aminoimidazole carboxamide ribotide isomerase|nr:1-(5-phosphoribosyl)-5-[(5-phosphoribosylamino)methylideneamino]imidazole-4-carboxamide isomerase [Deltaproteobacteria bacterium]